MNLAYSKKYRFVNNPEAPEILFINVGKSLYGCSFSGLDYSEQLEL